jgi:hypothetical protein
VFFTLATTSALSEVIKLECNLLIETRYSEGSIRKENSIATVDINVDNYFQTIKIKNHKLIAIVDSEKTDETVSFSNRSDSGKWELRSEDFNAQKNFRVSTQIRIDRNTGKIFFESRFTDSTGFLNTSGYGDCIKIDTTKRKF